MKVALFDLDGVLVRGLHLFKLWKFFYSEGYVTKGDTRIIFSLVNRYLRGKIPYRAFADEGIVFAASCIRGMDKEDIEKSAAKFIRNVKVPYYRYATELIRTFKKNDYKTIIISGSNMELLNGYNKTLKADKIYGSIFEIKKGRYMGAVKINMSLEESKRRVLGKMANIDFPASFAFGDSDQDMAILEKVGNPVALNPTQPLRKIAQERGWTILTKKDDVVGIVRAML